MIIRNSDNLREIRESIRFIEHDMVYAPAPIIMPRTADAGVRMLSGKTHFCKINNTLEIIFGAQPPAEPA